MVDDGIELSNYRNHMLFVNRDPNLHLESARYGGSYSPAWHRVCSSQDIIFIPE